MAVRTLIPSSRVFLPLGVLMTRAMSLFFIRSMTWGAGCVVWSKQCHRVLSTRHAKAMLFAVGEAIAHGGSSFLLLADSSSDCRAPSMILASVGCGIGETMVKLPLATDSVRAAALPAFARE